MDARANVSAARGIFGQLCPRCRTGDIFRSSIFRGFPKMHECCPVCGLKFEREEGYFLGAMYISYGLAIIRATGSNAYTLLARTLDLSRPVN